MSRLTFLSFISSDRSLIVDSAEVVAATSEEEDASKADEQFISVRTGTVRAGSPRRLDADLDFDRAPLSPDSGQRIRLRGGAGPWEGYVEVRAAQDKPWGHVCDSSDAWTIQDAAVICRTLGFLRQFYSAHAKQKFLPYSFDTEALRSLSRVLSSDRSHWTAFLLRESSAPELRRT